MLIYATPHTFHAITLSDDGQGDLFHPHRNHLAAIHNGVVYYQVTAPFYAYLRTQREALRERTISGALPLAEFNTIDTRFLAIRSWAIETLGEMAVKSTVLAFSPASYHLPTSIYTPAPKEASLPFWADFNPDETITEQSTPEQSGTSHAPRGVAQGPGQPEAPSAEFSSLTSAPQALPPVPVVVPVPPPCDPAVASHCALVAARTLAEVSRLYFACEGYDTPLLWANEQVAAGDLQVADLLERLRRAELAYEALPALASSTTDQVDRAAVAYLAAWRTLIYRYDDFVTENRRTLAEKDILSQ